MERNIPDGAIPLKEGAAVYAAGDKQVGDIVQVFVDPDSNRVTHLLIAMGRLFKSHKLVPTQWIDQVEEDRVTLAMGADFLESLPDYDEDGS